MLITIIICLILFSSYLFNRKVKFYDLLLAGITSGINQIFKLAAPIITITIVVELFINSGIINIIEQLLPFSKIPIEIYLQLIIKPISYNSSLVFMIQIFEKYGINDIYSYLSSLIQGAFDSTFFVCCLYFNEVKNNYFKKTITNALVVNILSALVAIILWYVIF